MHPITLTRQGTRAGAGWTRVTRGAHRRTDSDDPQLADLTAWQAVLPSEARFTHLTGASVHDLWLPPVPEDLPVWVLLPYGVPRPDRPGLRVIRSGYPGAPAYVDGLRVDSPGRCVQRAARDLHELDLTCLHDAVRHLHDASRTELETLARSRVPGIPRFRRALSWSDDRAESVWEVMLRVLHEYDGGDHLTRPQQSRDLRRSRRLGAAGWERRGYTSQDVLHRAASILRDADRVLGRPHDPSRVRPWHELLRRSLFTPAGTELLRRRLRLAGPVGEKVS